MSIRLKLLIILLLISTSASAAGSLHSVEWKFYHFNGKKIIHGRPEPGVDFIAIADGIRPAIARSEERLDPVPLPPDRGGVAGIAYIAVSGGKSGIQHEYLPAGRMKLNLASGNKIIATLETGENGYFAADLPPGRYRIGISPFFSDVSIEKGVTAIVSIRAGKRMVD